MPQEWKTMLNSSNISKEEQKMHPQAVVDVLKFLNSESNNKNSKFMTAAKISSGNVFAILCDSLRKAFYTHIVKVQLLFVF